MKLLIASDIHGAARWCKQLMTAIDHEQPDRILLLGDLLYHGPRNNVPDDYAPKEVISMLNGVAERIIAVRGNCEAEVDQMVLGFPCMADYTVIFDATDTVPARELFCTHGHIFGAGMHNSVNNLPALPPKSALVYGHTHIKVNEQSQQYPGLWLFNPGSVGIPKDGSHSFGIYEDGLFSHHVLTE
ncbi:MAG: phosphodiesterase [Atopobiaceae bacterium]|jgi:putative phosphoesterase|nr:phosphodiesterase [Atopobiaceae bacterium]